MTTGSIYLLYYLFLFDSGIVWLAIPAYAIFPIVHRICRKEWRNLFSWIDLVAYFASHSIWLYGLTHDFNHRGAGRLLDIFVIGFIFGIAVLLRIPLVWRHAKWRFRAAAISALLLVGVSVILTWILNLSDVD